MLRKGRPLSSHSTEFLHWLFWWDLGVSGSRYGGQEETKYSLFKALARKASNRDQLWLFFEAKRWWNDSFLVWTLIVIDVFTSQWFCSCQYNFLDFLTFAKSKISPVEPMCLWPALYPLYAGDLAFFKHLLSRSLVQLNGIMVQISE